MSQTGIQWVCEREGFGGVPYQSISVSLKYLSNRPFRGYKTSYVALTTVEKRALREQQLCT